MFSNLDSLEVSSSILVLIILKRLRLTLFTAIFLVYNGDSQGKIDSSVHHALEGMDNEVILASHTYQPPVPVKAAKMSRDIPKGPYFFSPSTGEIYQALRLYSDHQLAFTQAAISDTDGGYKSLPAATEVNERLIG